MVPRALSITQRILARMNARDLLEKAYETMQDRGRIYGHPAINQGRIADRITTLLEVPVTDYQAALIMVEVKLARLQESPSHMDSYLDAVAYLAIACELATEDSALYV